MRRASASISALKRDVFIFTLSTAAAVALTLSGILAEFLLITADIELFAAFAAGMFFTTFLTTPLSIAAFITIGHDMHPALMALCGASGAVLGDLVLFGLFRHAVRQDLDHLISLKRLRVLRAVFRRRMFRWLLPLLGALIIASPLPDELGIAIMGATAMRPRTLIVISFAMNFLGIFAIGIAVR